MNKYFSVLFISAAIGCINVYALQTLSYNSVLEGFTTKPNSDVNQTNCYINSQNDLIWGYIMGKCCGLKEIRHFGAIQYNKNPRLFEYCIPEECSKDNVGYTPVYKLLIDLFPSTGLNVLKIPKNIYPEKLINFQTKLNTELSKQNLPIQNFQIQPEKFIALMLALSYAKRESLLDKTCHPQILEKFQKVCKGRGCLPKVSFLCSYCCNSDVDSSIQIQKNSNFANAINQAISFLQNIIKAVEEENLDPSDAETPDDLWNKKPFFKNFVSYLIKAYAWNVLQKDQVLPFMQCFNALTKDFILQSNYSYSHLKMGRKTAVKPEFFARKRPNFKGDPLYISPTKELLYKPSTPFPWTHSNDVLNMGMAKMVYDGKEYRFSDCGETILRNLITLLFFKNGSIDTLNLPSRIKNFFSQHNFEEAAFGTTPEIRGEWALICSGFPNVNYVCNNRCEIVVNLSNILKALCQLLDGYSGSEYAAKGIAEINKLSCEEDISEDQAEEIIADIFDNANYPLSIHIDRSGNIEISNPNFPDMLATCNLECHHVEFHSKAINPTKITVSNAQDNQDNILINMWNLDQSYFEKMDSSSILSNYPVPEFFLRIKNRIFLQKKDVEELVDRFICHCSPAYTEGISRFVVQHTPTDYPRDLLSKNSAVALRVGKLMLDNIHRSDDTDLQKAVKVFLFLCKNSNLPSEGNEKWVAWIHKTLQELFSQYPPEMLWQMFNTFYNNPINRNMICSNLFNFDGNIEMIRPVVECLNQQISKYIQNHPECQSLYDTEYTNACLCLAKIINSLTLTDDFLNANPSIQQELDRFFHFFRKYNMTVGGFDNEINCSKSEIQKTLWMIGVWRQPKNIEEVNKLIKK